MENLRAQKPEMAKWPESGIVYIGTLAKPIVKTFLEAYELTPKEVSQDKSYRGLGVGNDILGRFKSPDLTAKLDPERLRVLEETEKYRCLHEIFESVILLGMEQGRRIDIERLVAKEDVEKVFADIIAGKNIQTKISSPSFPLANGWPKKTVFVDLLIDPLARKIRNIYHLKRVNKGKDIPYYGYNISERFMSTTLDPQESLTAENIKYKEENQGNDLVSQMLLIGLQVGIENGLRYVSQGTLLRTKVFNDLIRAIA